MSLNENYRFHEDVFLFNSFFDMRGTKTKMTPSCSPFQAGSNHVCFDIERSISKFDLGSGQGQIVSQVGQYAHPPKRLDGPSRLALFARL